MSLLPGPSSTSLPMGTTTSHQSRKDKQMDIKLKKSPSSSKTKVIKVQRRRKPLKRLSNYHINIKRVLKGMHPETQLSTSAMSVVNSFVNDMFALIASEASRLAKYAKRQTLTHADIYAACRLVLPSGLSKQANHEATRALIRYSNSFMK